MINKEKLQQIVQEQEAQLLNYEKKLKDVVRAYKSIESEKKALEVALTALSCSNQKVDEKSDENLPAQKSETVITTEEQLESLKQALSTLTIENKKKEVAFQVDRKSLLATKERLTEEINQLKKAAVCTDVERRLREQLADVEAQREKMLSEHGSMVAEMQQRYAKERKHTEQMEKQVTQLSHRLQEKDDIIQSMENRAKEYVRMEQELQRLRKKAEANPTAQVLKQELVNVKNRYEEELSSVRNRHVINFALLSEKDSRICTLEERIKSLTEEGASTAVENAELRSQVDELTNQLLKLSEASISSNNVGAEIKQEASRDVQTLKSEIREACRDLISCESAISISALLSEFCADSLETSPASFSRDSDNGDKIKSEGCNLCNSAQREAADCKIQIRELERKLRSLEDMHCTTKEEHFQTSDALKKRIAELETNQERTYSQLSSKCMEKVMEMEEELRRQQVRMREIIAEKDKEIEYARNTLSSLSTKTYNSPPQHCVAEIGSSTTPIDPLDPEPRTFDGELRQLCDFDSTSEEHAFDNSDGLLPLQDTNNLQSHGFCHRQSTIESRNIFYEQELSKRKQEIIELRNVVRLSELKVRDIEQAMLTKDIQYLQIVETLKEEIRVLEGKLSLEQSETNLAYLRNIFVQLLNSNSAKGRKHILKAMGAVLKLTKAEMKRIEFWNI